MSTKSDILSILEEKRPSFISGQEIADLLNVSRTSVWKAIRALENDGYVISAVRNMGYRIDGSSDVLSKEAVLSSLGSGMLPPRIEVLKTVDSTNSYAKKLALEGALSGTLIISEEQTAGRGRRGKSFFSPQKSGVYMSVVLRPDRDFSDVQLITLAAAVSVCEAISELTEESPQIKWVNDIFLHGKKICGILSEAGIDLEGRGIDYVIVGIGINCTTSEADFPEMLRSIAGSIGENGIQRSQLAALVYERMMRYFPRLGDGSVLDRYRDLSLMYGKEVEFIYDGQSMSGVVLGINDDGSLLVRCHDGVKISLVGGEVSVHGDFE